MSRLVDFGAYGVAKALGVTLGAASPRASVTYSVTTSWLASGNLGFAPQTGDALALISYLDNGSDVDPVALTIGGQAVTVREHTDAGHGGTVRGCGALAGTVRGLATGAQRDVVVTTHGNNGAGRIAAWFVDLVGWTGTVGAHAPILVTGGAGVTQASGSITVVGGGSLLVAIVCVSDADTGPLVAAGWTKFAEATVGTAAGTSNAAACFSRTGGDPGAVVGFTAVGDLAWSEWAGVVLEIL